MNMYFVYCRTIKSTAYNVPTNTNCWFAYEDGDFVISSAFNRATSFTEMSDALQALDYAKSRTAGTLSTPSIVTVTLNVSEVADPRLFIQQEIDKHHGKLAELSRQLQKMNNGSPPLTKMDN